MKERVGTTGKKDGKFRVGDSRVLDVRLFQD